MIPPSLYGDPRGLVIVDWSMLVRAAYRNDGVSDVASQVLGKLWRILFDGDMPASICFAVDPERVDPETGCAVRRRTWRDMATAHLPESKQYKSGRIPKPAELVRIERRMFQVAAALKIPFLLPENPAEEQAYDADDAMGTAAKLARSAGRRVAILTRDKDMFQCVRDDEPSIVRWWPFLTQAERDNGEPEQHDEQAVIRKLSVMPSQVVDYLALMGDTSDNVPGVNGIGKKKAAEILFAHGSLDNALSNSPITKAEAKIHEQREQALASRELVQLRDYAPIRWEPQKQMIGGFDLPKLRELLRDFGFTRMAENLPSFPKARFDIDPTVY